MGIMSAFTGDIISKVGSGLDSLFTSDEERLEARNKFSSIMASIQVSGNELSAKVNEALTSRHATDMQSDSWLSKNIRPITLVVMVSATLGFITLVTPTTTVELAAYEIKLGLLTTLDMVVFGFYFGSRGLEKIASSVATAVAKTKQTNKGGEDDLW